MNILAVNPWIYDVAAYDYWLKPYGFLALLTYLNQNPSIHIDYIDCLNAKTKSGTFGRGKFQTEKLTKPEILKDFPIKFKRYGIKKDEFSKSITDIKADYILVTSSMSYWYPAIKDAVELLRNAHPGTPIILGGIYATLCNDHAKKNIASDITIANDELESLFSYLNVPFNQNDLLETLPEYELFYKETPYIVLRTSWGCPFNCNYCALKNLYPGFNRIPLEKVLSFLEKYSRQGIFDFVFYDDAFLYGSDYIKTLLKAVIAIKKPFRFHTPNALHLRFLDEEIAFLMKKSGFINPHFGFETLNEKDLKSWDNKINQGHVTQAINNLKTAGFGRGSFSFYILLGYPGQDFEKTKQEIELLASQGVRINLSEFSPVPKTKISEELFSGNHDPLLDNNSIFYYTDINSKKIRSKINEIKSLVKRLNSAHSE
ncbi:MAG: radical SAM protein [Candidatus Omnitrophica bacterium]|nr:radical SAM protein [Candidatus Omnitrophota bacterium]